MSFDLRFLLSLCLHHTKSKPTFVVRVVAVQTEPYDVENDAKCQHTRELEENVVVLAMLNIYMVSTGALTLTVFIGALDSW